VCFHAQQCIEKLFKALLIDRGTIPPKAHDLVHLSRLVRAVCQDWDWSMEELRYLTRAAVDFRYPGESADAEEAEQALQICAKIRPVLLSLLGKESVEE